MGTWMRTICKMWLSTISTASLGELIPWCLVTSRSPHWSSLREVPAGHLPVVWSWTIHHYIYTLYFYIERMNGKMPNYHSYWRRVIFPRICRHTLIYICMYVCIYVYIYTTCIHIHTYIKANAHTHTHVYLYTYIYICIYIYIYSICTCIFTFIDMYIHIYLSNVCQMHCSVWDASFPSRHKVERWLMALGAAPCRANACPWGGLVLWRFKLGQLSCQFNICNMRGLAPTKLRGFTHTHFF
jgi:hypothetical protein